MRGIGETGLAGFFTFGVGALEFLSRQVQLAPDFDRTFWTAMKRMGNVFDRTDVRRYVLARRAVATCCGAHQTAIAILERDAEAINLQFGDVRHRSLEIAEPATKPFVKFLQFVFVIGVVQAEHRLGMLDRGEAFGDSAAGALSW